MVVMSNFHVTGNSASVTIFSRVTPEIEVLSPHAGGIGHSLEPGLSEPLVLKYLESPERETHSCSATLHQTTIGIRWLRSIVRDSVFGVAPYLRDPTLALRPIQ